MDVQLRFTDKGPQDHNFVKELSKNAI